MAEAGKDKLTRAERIFVRISVLQTVLAVVGIFTGAVALYAALIESDAVRRQLDASVWPRLEFGTDNWSKEAVARSGEWDAEESPLFRFTILNSGIGPARIRSVRVTIDGEPQEAWETGLRKLTGRDLDGFGSSTISGRVLQAGGVINAVSFWGDDASLVRDSLPRSDGDGNRIRIEVCYCAVYDSCWLTDGEDEAIGGEPAPVKKCPDFGMNNF